MKRNLIAVLALLAAVATLMPCSNAVADEAVHPSGALGFRDTSAPIGVRWWTAGQKVGVDLGFGFASHKVPNANTTNGADVSTIGWSADVGVPWVFKSWDRVHAIFRPGFLYRSDEQLLYDANGSFVGKDKVNTYFVTGELEAEVFLAKNVSFSASHGIYFFSTKTDIANAKAETEFGTFGSNLTALGFHLYLFGGE